MRGKLLITCGVITVLAGSGPATAALTVVPGGQHDRIPDIWASDLIQLAQAAGPGNNAAAAAAAAAAPSSTGGGGTGTTGTGTGSDPSSGGTTIVRTNLSWLITNMIRKDIAAADEECGQYDKVYRIDCLRQNLDHMIRNLPSDGDYRDARQILQNASQRLGAIVSRYADPEAPRLVPRSRVNQRFLQRRSYRAVRRDKVDRALSEARQVMQEAATQLLRSSENSQARLAHYETIATAVNSTKVLLRS